MRRRSFTVSVEHDDSLFPDEGALLAAIKSALFTKHAWFTNERTDAMSVKVTEDAEAAAGHDLDDMLIVLEEVLIYHQRLDIGHCGCGWAELGESHAKHVAGVFRDSLIVRFAG